MPHILGIIVKGRLFNGNGSSFTSNLCGIPNGVFIRILHIKKLINVFVKAPLLAFTYARRKKLKYLESQMMKTSLMVKKKNKQTTKKFIRVITIYQWHSRYGPILITYEINLLLCRIAPINQQTEARKGCTLRGGC